MVAKEFQELELYYDADVHQELSFVLLELEVGRLLMNPRFHLDDLDVNPEELDFSLIRELYEKTRSVKAATLSEIIRLYQPKRTTVLRPRYYTILKRENRILYKIDNYNAVLSLSQRQLEKLRNRH